VNQQDNSDAYFARVRIDGSFSFALAVFAVGLGLLAVLERVGLPDKALKFCVGALIFSGFIIIAGFLRTMRPADFYAAGRTLPAPYAGLAYAGLAAGLFLPFLPPLPEGIGLNSVAAGFCVGLFGAVFAIGPYLRHSGAFSIADLAGSRFPHPAVRCAIGLIAAVCAGLVAVCGYECALQALVAATGVSRGLGAVVLGVLLVLLVVPGGLAGVIWLTAGSAVVTLVALGLPSALSILRESAPWTSRTLRFDAVTGQQPNLPLDPALVIAIALGLAALTPLFGPAVASRDKISAFRSGPFAFIFVAIIAVLASLTLARSTLALDAALVGREPGKLAAEILAASERGGVTICGVQSDVQTILTGSCADETGFNGVLRLQDVEADAGYLLENLPVLRQAGPTLSGLSAAFAIALGIAVAAAGVQSFATSLGHDVFHPNRRRFGPATRRLAFARGLAILLIALCGACLAARPSNPRVFITLALTISAALMAPLIGLTWLKRATSFDALAALLVAAPVMGRFIFAHPQSWPPLELATNVIFAAVDGLFAGVFVSFLHGRNSLTARPAIPPAKDEPLGPD
jgi:cation/acetate symporter